MGVLLIGKDKETGSFSLTAKPKKSALHQLTKKLLKNYSKGVRPVNNWTEATVVYIDFILQSVLDVDGQNQKVTTSIWYRQIWNDQFLMWDPAAFDGINEISLSSDAIWVPDIIISEFVDVGRSPYLPYVYVNSSGMVKNYKPIQVVSACSLEMYAFPFDKQNCTLTFRSWLHTVNEVDLAMWRTFEEVKNEKRAFMNDGEWELVAIPARYEQLHMETRDYAQIQFNVIIRRRPLLYVVSLLIPSIFLMVVDVMSFYLPPNCGTRITFKASLLLGYTVFRVNISDDLPATAIQTPLIGVFFAACMALLVLSLAKSIFIVKLLHHNDKTVKGTTVSSSMLTKYGSSSLIFNENSLQSMKTKEDLNQIRGFDAEIGSDEESVVINGEHTKNLILEKIHEEIVLLNYCLRQVDNTNCMKIDWLALCYEVDKVLFRVYLFILVIYTSTLCSLWALWGGL
ncbi:5-hydroxytryptamine receptor 3B [Polypterus senegalus]|uniref:5-hydroxytryptamine receptor 3B n=1 Tax=Polypterus senegalus TaxID=55291 RepID=UPI0019633D83|nr:5-hydroxytryptamine receptor 3B [Polypterus senegalus]